jgi:phosphoglycolate phosphatase-like HAD superfamily hydrolase
MNTPANNQKEKDEPVTPSILVWGNQLPWQQPHLEEKTYNRRVIKYWRGFASIEDIRGWVENPRIDLFVKKFKIEHQGTAPTNDDILAWMLDNTPRMDGKTNRGEFDLEGLGDNIGMNGVHEPIIINSDGTLLDGNRRYFAALLKYRQALKDNPAAAERAKYLPAYVLMPGATRQDLEAILIFRNYGSGFHQPWPSYIRADKVCDDLEELTLQGIPKREARLQLAEKYNEKTQQIARYEKVMRAIDEFRDYHLTPDEEEGRQSKDELAVEEVCHHKFEYFDELSKPRIVSCLNADPDFRATTYERLFNGEFENFVWIRRLPDIATEPKAREVFLNGSQTGRNPVEEAIEVVQLFRLVKKAVGANERIQSFAKWLRSLTAEDYVDLDAQSVSDLRDIAELAAQIAEAVKQPK